MSIVFDGALSAVYSGAVAMIRDNGVGDGDFQKYPENIRDAITEFQASLSLLDSAVDNGSSDDEVQVLTEELYEKTLMIAMGGMLLLGSFPLFDLIVKPTPGEVKLNA